MICGQTGEFGPIFHNFIDFVAVLLLLATIICVLCPAGKSHGRLFPPKLLAEVPLTVRTMSPAAGRPAKMSSLLALANSITKYSVSCCKLLWQNMKKLVAHNNHTLKGETVERYIAI